MRFFARITFICNASFILALILRWVEIGRQSSGKFDAAIKFQPLEATLVILGYGAVFINLVFCFFLAYRLLLKKTITIPRWIIVSNVLILPFQIYFFFFSN